MILHTCVTIACLQLELSLASVATHAVSEMPNKRLELLPCHWHSTVEINVAQVNCLLKMRILRSKYCTIEFPVVRRVNNKRNKPFV